MSKEAAKQITPVVLTYNEEPNIERTLASLTWAQRVIVLDSGSTDLTTAIAQKYSNVEWLTRPFDSFLGQWEFAIHETGITTEFILGLDADMAVTSELLEELETRFLLGSYAAGLMPFDYRYYGRSLAGSLCAPQIRIFRAAEVKVTQPNHGHKFTVTGEVYRFRNSLIHDDQKPLERWVQAQLSYLAQNEREVVNGDAPGLRGRLRKLGVMPPVMGMLAYMRAGGPFGGAAAVRYAYERTVAEGLLAIRLMDARLRKNNDEGPRPNI
jgi:glycosyltransferase involved in cell wall biosynthesis